MYILGLVGIRAVITRWLLSRIYSTQTKSDKGSPCRFMFFLSSVGHHPDDIAILRQSLGFHPWWPSSIRRCRCGSKSTAVAGLDKLGKLPIFCRLWLTDGRRSACRACPWAWRPSGQSSLPAAWLCGAWRQLRRGHGRLSNSQCSKACPQNFGRGGITDNKKPALRPVLRGFRAFLGRLEKIVWCREGLEPIAGSLAVSGFRLDMVFRLLTNLLTKRKVPLFLAAF